MKPVAERLALTILVVGAIVWLGASNIRALIGEQFFEFGTIRFLKGIDPRAERAMFEQIALVSVVAGAAYAVTWIAAVAFLCATPLRIRLNGWLLMSAILFFVFTPVEVYTMILDWRFVVAAWWGSTGPDDLRWLFLHRVTALSGLPVIATLCYYTIIPLAVWRPLVKK